MRLVKNSKNSEKGGYHGWCGCTEATRGQKACNPRCMCPRLFDLEKAHDTVERHMVTGTLRWMVESVPEIGWWMVYINGRAGMTERFEISARPGGGLSRLLFIVELELSRKVAMNDTTHEI